MDQNTLLVDNAITVEKEEEAMAEQGAYFKVDFFENFFNPINHGKNDQVF